MFDFNKQFFTAHQSKLLFIANKWYLRWFLGLNRLPKKLKGKKIVKIDVDAFHFATRKRFTKRGKPRFEYTVIFFTRPRFAEALAYNLTPFVYFQQLRSEKMIWRFSPLGLVGALLLLLTPKASFFGFFGTTSTYYSGYGECGINYNNTVGSGYSTIRDYTGSGGSLGKNGTEDGCLSYRYSNNYYITRFFLKFDTSAIGTGAIISSASLFAYNTPDTQTGSAQCGVFDSTAADTLVAGDYSHCGTTSQSDTYWTYNASSYAYREFPLNTAGKGSIQKIGTTKFSLRDYTNDVLNNTPGYNTSVGGAYFHNSTYTGTDHDPYLSVTYSSDVTPVNSNFFAFF